MNRLSGGAASAPHPSLRRALVCTSVLVLAGAFAGCVGARESAQTSDPRRDAAQLTPSLIVERSDAGPLARFPALANSLVRQGVSLGSAARIDLGSSDAKGWTMSGRNTTCLIVAGQSGPDGVSHTVTAKCERALDVQRRGMAMTIGPWRTGTTTGVAVVGIAPADATDVLVYGRTKQAAPVSSLGFGAVVQKPYRLEFKTRGRLLGMTKLAVPSRISRLARR